MHKNQHNDWLARAAVLDRFRWKLLRKRHGVWGASIRFLRDYLVDTLFGALARFRVGRAASKHTCDFLLLQSAPKVIAFQRKKLLKLGITKRGYSLIEIALEEGRTILSGRLLEQPPQWVPLRYFGYAAHAQWIVSHYNPRVLLNDRNGSFYSPFLRLALNAHGRPLVHLAHATATGSSRMTMNDYDYYFMFGQSSLDALNELTLRYGSSTAVLAGSHMINEAYAMLPQRPESRSVLVLGVGPDKEKEPGYLRTYGLLLDWIGRHPEYKVSFKSHPRSKAQFWNEASLTFEHLKVLPTGVPLSSALEPASLVINIMSNAVIEAALARRPVIYVNLSGNTDVLSQEVYFGPIVETITELEARVEMIELDYPRHVEAAQRFAEYHLAHGNLGLEHSLQLLDEIYQTGQCAGVSLPQVGLN